MSDLRSAAAQKWACEYCTYENFPVSKKCTLCRAPRQPQYIDEDVQEQDIYKMAPLITRANNQCSTHSVVSGMPSIHQPLCVTSQMLDPKNKWACQACTYLNWPRAVRCTQCLTNRPKAVAVLNPSTTQPLSINVNIDQQPTSTPPSGGTRSGSTTQKNSPKTSPNSPEAAKSINNDINRSVAAGVKSLGKWMCKACTYENWPRTIRCVLCGLQKGHSLTTDSSLVSSNSSTLSSPTVSPSSAVARPVSATSPMSTKPSVTFTNKGSLACHTEGDASTASRPLSSTSRRKKKSPPCSSPHSPASPASRSMENIEAIGATASPASNQIYQDRQSNTQGDRFSGTAKTDDKKVQVLRSRFRDLDWLWLNACQGVVEGDTHAVEAFLSAGGDPARQLTGEECSLLGRPRVFELNYTLVHLAIRFQREDMLAALLTATDVVAKAKKRVPAHVAPDIATDILREISSSIRQRKGDFPCFFVTELTTFALPADIEDLPNPIKKQLFDEILDRGVQKELEDEEPVVNWSGEITQRLGSRLYGLWNRTAGDCLLDSVLQATWGIMDRDNTLRRALSDSLAEGANMFYPRWKDTEAMQAQSLHFSLDENQWQQDWAIILSIASQPGSSLEQVHIFALAHILRRPIIVYGIKFVKSFRGENIGLARFQGVYLPLLWERSFCWKTPIALGYTRGHFSALVAMEVDMCENIGAGAHIDNHEDVQITYLPLMDNQGKLLPIHFLSPSEVGHEETLLKEWMDVCVTSGGLLVAQQRITKPPILVRQMLDEWMDRYRRLSRCLKSTSVPPSRSAQTKPKAPVVSTEALSSEEETDDE